MKKNIYILDTPLYFGTAKKVYKYCLDNGYPVVRTFVKFKKWLYEDGHYELTNIGYITYSEIV
jgi:hypothetical protein